MANLLTTTCDLSLLTMGAAKLVAVAVVTTIISPVH